MSLTKKALVVVTLSLLSSTPLQAMDGVDERDNTPKTPTLTIETDKLPNSRGSCSPLDPRCGTTFTCADFAAARKGHMADSLKAIMNQKVVSFLKDFEIPSQNADKLWEDFHKIVTEKGQIRPFVPANQDPYFIASSLWRADQELLSQDTTNKHLFSFKTLLSALLTRDVYIKGATFTVKDVHLLKSLLQSNPYFRKLDLLESGITDEHLAILATLPHLEELLLENNKYYG